VYPLGEAPRISGSVVLVIVLVLALTLALAAGGVMIWQGCVMAGRAGRGDRTGLRMWVAIVVIEVVLAFAGLVFLFGPVLLVQVALYVRGQATEPPAGDGPEPPTPRSGS
jgi:hypothetical protein